MSIAERYLSATNTRNLRLKPEAVCDADTLLAAGYAASGDPRKDLALKVWRMKQTGDRSGFDAVVEQCEEVLRKNNTRGYKLKGRSFRDVASRTLFWWMSPACMDCNGLGHPLVEGTPHLNEHVKCPVCNGTGEFPLHKVVGHKFEPHAADLVAELHVLSAEVFKDMARRLAPEMDLGK